MSKENNKKIDLEDALTELVELRHNIQKDVNLGHELLEEIRREERIRNRTIGVVAIAAILAMAMWVFGPSFLNLDPVLTFDNHYSRMNPDLLTRDGGTDNILTKAIQAYQNGESESAVEMLASSEAHNIDSQVAEFFLALAYLDSGQLNLAKSSLENLLSEGILIQPEISWYLSLINLKEEDFDSAKQNLKSLKKVDAGFKEKEVRKLRQKLRFR
ncbi:MAG: hypothetical protein U9N86_00130 [Bacteroidota bacterium]|nr:hypothetical protein [Bacteroidota bacterium]